MTISIRAFITRGALVAAFVSAGSGAAAQTRAASGALPAGVAVRDVHFFSEHVQCHARLFLPQGFNERSQAPGVVLAPGWGETAASIEGYAARFASRGIVSMAIDYRGWGKSGGFLYLVEDVRFDDRLRFSQHTAKVRIARKRLVPRHQILDIRNAIAYLQGEPGVDRARIGVWGTDMAGGHMMQVAATDARITAAVAQVPVIAGRDAPRQAWAPTGQLHQDVIRRARSGEGVSDDVETRLALAEYHPFWSVDEIPESTAVLFVIAGRDGEVDNEAHAVAASKRLKGPTRVVTVPGATHDQIGRGPAFETSANAAVEWFLEHLVVAGR